MGQEGSLKGIGMGRMWRLGMIGRIVMRNRINLFVTKCPKTTTTSPIATYKPSETASANPSTTKAAFPPANPPPTIHPTTLQNPTHSVPTNTTDLLRVPKKTLNGTRISVMNALTTRNFC